VLFDKDKPYTGNSVVSVLARNVAGLMGHPLNPVIMVEVVQAVTTQIETSNLDALVKAAAKQLFV
jgi:hypothetical protein